MRVGFTGTREGLTEAHPAVLARWGAVVVSAEGDARAVAWRVARLVMDVMAREAPGDGR